MLGSGWINVNQADSQNSNNSIYTNDNVFDEGLIASTAPAVDWWAEWQVSGPPVYITDTSILTGTQFPMLGLAPTVLPSSQVYDAVRGDVGANRNLGNDHQVVVGSDFVDDEYFATLAQGPGVQEDYTSNSSSQSFDQTQRYLDFHDPAYKNKTPE